ncbi:MAG: hypothetical protein WDN45_02955 [Caulobacteraceae bacterium]
MRTALRLQAIAIAAVIGLLAAPAALSAAPAGPAEKGANEAPAAMPDKVGGVVVQAPRGRSKLGAIAPDKKAALDQEAARNEAWKTYRKSTPPAAAGTLGQSKDYPGLQALAPQ